jgi:hypothetical protein
MRRLRIRKDQPNSPADYPFAVCKFSPPKESEIIAWFKIEGDAKIFAEAEPKIAELGVKLKKEEQRRMSEVNTAYRRALVLR